MRIIHSSNKYFTTWFIAIASMLSLTGCYDKIGLEVTRPIEEGVPTHVSLGYAAQESIVETRAEQTPEYENRIENIYLFVFNSAGQRQPLLENIDGTLRGNSLFTFSDGLNPTGDNLSNGAGTLEFVCGSLSGARIVAIANVTTGSTGTAYEVTPGELDEIQDLVSLQQFVMTMNSQSVSRGALFMMTGYAVDNENGSTSIDIAGSESGTVLDCALQLERTDAKVSFEVTAVPNPPEGKTWTKFSFLPKEWTVKRVPMQSYILEQEDGEDYDGQDAVYFSTPAVPFEKINPNPGNEDLYTGGSFVFYMPENNKTPLQTIEDYSQREAWTKEDENGDKVFDYAHANSTYVEMTGVLSYQDNDGRQVNADVRFTVHLGYSKKEDGTADVNDYATRRNSHYTYNITIRGINDIIVEVSSDNGNDPRPGYEGDVVYSNDQIFEFDSHYDRRLIKLNRADIGSDMKWSVNTPFSRGIHDVGEDIPQAMRDYRWIKFAVNADYGVDSDKYVKYPGDQNYDDPYPMDASNNNLPSPYYKELGYENARLRDIEQLLSYLQSEAVKTDSKVFDSNGDVAITVFVDENLYFNHPITNQPGEENRSLWKLTADKDDRQLHIIVEGAQYSKDGNSSVVNSKFSFKQRTIRTVFNVDKPELTTAWGLESTMETGRLATGDVSMGTDTRNGRANCLEWLVGERWTDIIETNAALSSENALKQPYRNAAYACMLRNRDLDGDNIIDANEVRWYLASIDQLTDIYLGESALDEQSRLYPSNPADREYKVRWHYTSSSANGNESWILWAEEGASRGGSSDSKDDNGDTNEKFSYRCVRNLGIPLNQPDQVPADLIKVIEEADGSYLIDVTNMSEKARRSNFEVNRLPAHNERDADNKPYAKFRVHPGTFPEPDYDNGWNNQLWSYYQTWNGYPEGYRIPNQRELLIMTTRMPEDAWLLFEDIQYVLFYPITYTIKPDYVCQTAFSLNGEDPYSSERYGFMWHSSNRHFFLQNDSNNGGPEKGYVRPVQDVAE